MPAHTARTSLKQAPATRCLWLLQWQEVQPPIGLKAHRWFPPGPAPALAWALVTCGEQGTGQRGPLQAGESMVCELAPLPRLCSLKELGPYRCVVSFSRFFGRLMIMMASNGHFCADPPRQAPARHDSHAARLVFASSAPSRRYRSRCTAPLISRPSLRWARPLCTACLLAQKPFKSCMK